MGNGKRLDLDGLFGRRAEPIVVNWQGREYELRRPEELGPRELILYQRLQERSGAVLRAEPATPVDEEQQADELEEILRLELAIVSRELAALNLSYFMVMRVLDFYSSTIREREAGGETEDPKPPTP